MINKPPAFQFYADDFLAGTFAMSNEERGLYITLLCRQWTQGHVTQDEMARLSSGMAQPLASHVFAKFKKAEDGLFKNERLELERSKQASFRANRSESGKAGAEKRWHSHSTANGKPMASGMAKHSSPSPSPSPKEDIASSNVPNSRMEKPTIEAMKLYAAKIGLPDTEAEKAWHFYESKGWKIGSSPMRSWQSALVNWRSRWQEKNTNASKTVGGNF